MSDRTPAPVLQAGGGRGVTCVSDLTIHSESIQIYLLFEQAGVISAIIFQLSSEKNIIISSYFICLIAIQIKNIKPPNPNPNYQHVSLK